MLEYFIAKKKKKYAYLSVNDIKEPKMFEFM